MKILLEKFSLFGSQLEGGGDPYDFLFLWEHSIYS